LEKAEIWEIIICETEEKTECALARALAEEFQPIPHFGSSDCQCGSHLYFGGEKCRLETKVIETMDEAGLAHRIFYSR
jgi:endonuclease-3